MMYIKAEIRATRGSVKINDDPPFIEHTYICTGYKAGIVEPFMCVRKTRNEATEGMLKMMI